MHEEFLWELDIAQDRLLAVSQVLPDGLYAWRPEIAARSASEILVHVAAGSFFLLDIAGVAAPADLYFDLPPGNPERLQELIRRNQELEKTLCDKDAVVGLLNRSFAAVREALRHSTAGDFERGVHFLGEETTVGRVYLRLLAHTHEHMGQMLAYLRSNGIAPPPPNWRPTPRP
jgi:hypothetical protein